MKIINKYFIKQLTVIFVMFLLALTGLSWMLQIMTMMKFLLTYGVNIGDFLGLSFLMVPFIMSIIIPFVTFIAIIFVYNKLIAENEITVLASAGMSAHQIARPAIGVAIALTAIHFLLNLWIVPVTQEKFYDTQWELRYGLAHMKLQEAAFTKMTDGLVVYVDKVSGYDLSEIMLSDTRNPNSDTTIMADKGKLVSTNRGLSLIMSKGSLQSRDKTFMIGTFDSFDMDLNLSSKDNIDEAFRVRRESTFELLKSVKTIDTIKKQKSIMSELGKRFYTPLMNLILAAMCLLILLKSSLLRRRVSYAPLFATVAMAGAMSGFMSISSTLTSITSFVLLGVTMAAVLTIIIIILLKK